MRNDAESHSEEDVKRKDMIEIRNKAETEIFNHETNRKEFDSVMTPEESEKLDDAISKARQALDSNDKSEIEAVMATLKEVTDPIYREGYQRKQQQQKEKE